MENEFVGENGKILKYTDRVIESYVTVFGKRTFKRTKRGKMPKRGIKRTDKRYQRKRLAKARMERKKEKMAILRERRKEEKKTRYKVIMCMNGTHKKTFGYFNKLEKAYEVFNKLINDNKGIIFPRSVKAFGRTQDDFVGEYIILEKSGTNVSFLRNDYGKMVKHVTTRPEWSILDKARFDIEETFWVFGYDNMKERKDILWIYENLLTKDIETRYDTNRVLVYKNKLIIKHDDGTMDMVICKCDEDCVKMYNILQDFVKKDKLKCVVFIGDYSKTCFKSKRLVDEIEAFTGWSRKKISMRNTTYYSRRTPKNHKDG